MRSQALRSAAIRVGALRLAILFLFLLLAARAGQLTVISTEGRDQGYRQIQTSINVPGARGMILDRDGTELAISTNSPSIYALREDVDDSRATARSIAEILGVPRRQIEKRIVGKTGFAYVARWVTDRQAERIDALGLAGIGIEREPRRTYPAGSLAAPLLGFADIDGNGVRGVEQMLDGWLKGKARTVAVERDATGKLLFSRPLDPRVTAGGDILLSIDSGLQAEAEAALEDAVQSSGAKGGVIITIDPTSGDVLALAEYPGFDPNGFRSIRYATTRCRAFLDVVEPGSTFKAFLIAAALEAGTLSPQDEIDTGDGTLRLPGKTVKDHRPYGVLDPRGVLQFSSNVGSVLVATALGPQRHHAALRRFGFGSPTGSGFPAESGGLLRDWKRWQPVDHATVAYGQGLSVTPMQLAMALAALANGGERMRPRLVLARRKTLGRWQTTQPESLGQAVSRDTAETVLAMMESVVSEHGTAGRAALAGVRVAGKTGTAQKFDRDLSRYSQTRYTAWFMGVAPADDPRLAIVVALDEPAGKAHTGGAVAAPLFAQVAAAQLAHQGILTRPEPIAFRAPPSWIESETPATTSLTSPDEARLALAGLAAAPSNTRSATATTADIRVRPATRAFGTKKPGEIRMTETRKPHTATRLASNTATGPAPQAYPVLVPDFFGASRRRAERLAEHEALQLHIVGSETGAVSTQSPAPGTILDGSSRTVILSFSPRSREG